MDGNGVCNLATKEQTQKSWVTLQIHLPRIQICCFWPIIHLPASWEYPSETNHWHSKWSPVIGSFVWLPKKSEKQTSISAHKRYASVSRVCLGHLPRNLSGKQNFPKIIWCFPNASNKSIYEKYHLGPRNPETATPYIITACRSVRLATWNWARESMNFRLSAISPLPPGPKKKRQARQICEWGVVLRERIRSK